LPDRFALELAARLELRGLDWRRTCAFVLPGDDTGYIRLNLQGRERDGIVPLGEAEPLMKIIAAGLQTFRDINGGPTVASAERISAVVSSGERAHQLPDLLVRWTDTIAKPLKGVISPEFGVVHHPGWDSGRSGAHSDDAWLLVLPRSLRIRDRNRPPRVEDIAATACALLTGDTAGLAGESLLEPQSTSAP
jgi:predicted AlkP superfamily phosphohydrolase/phosphomutase